MVSKRGLQQSHFALVTFAVMSWSSPTWAIPPPVASYLFNNTLDAQESGRPALIAVDPLSLNTFEADTVFGQPRQVYRYSGNAIPITQEAGLSLDTTGMVPADIYSIELVFEFLEGAGTYRRIIDVQNRTADSGLYVAPSNQLVVFPVGAGTTPFTTNVFHHVVLTNSDGVVRVYLDGALEFAIPTTVMNINNPGDVVNFFLDDSGEFANGKVALIRIYNAPLSDSDVSLLALDPFAPVSACEADLAQCEADLTECLTNPGIPDQDGDGEPDATDECPNTAGDAAVDQVGCSLEQFCTAIDATTSQGTRVCENSDWRNDEPLMNGKEADCQVKKNGPGRGDDRCVARQ